MGHTCFAVKTKILISSWLHKFKFGSHTTEVKSSGKDEIKKKIWNWEETIKMRFRK
jgi:hypothetical protein